MSTPADAVRDLATRYFASIEEGDTDTLRACYDPQARIWHNTDDLVKTAETNIAQMEGFIRRYTDRVYDERRVRFFDGGFVQQHVLRATRISDGGRVALPTCVVIECPDGLITRLDGWFDSVAQAELAKG